METGISKGEVRVADQDGYATRTVGPDGETVRIQVKAGDVLPHDAELEGGLKATTRSGAKSEQGKAAAKDNKDD